MFTLAVFHQGRFARSRNFERWRSAPLALYVLIGHFHQCRAKFPRKKTLVARKFAET